MLKLGIFHANRTTRCLRNQDRSKGEGWSTADWLKPLGNFIAGRPRTALRFGSFVILDVVYCFFYRFFLLYINIEIGKIDVRC